MGDAAQGHDEQVQATGYPGEALACSEEASVIDRHGVTMTAHVDGHIGLQAWLVLAGGTSRVSSIRLIRYGRGVRTLVGMVRNALRALWAGPELFTEAIDAAADGDALMAPRIAARLLAAFALIHQGQPPQPPMEPLTGREEEVLSSAAQGWTNHEIADDLHISISTVKTHLASLMRKLNARNRVEIAMWAYETGRIKK